MTGTSTSTVELASAKKQRPASTPVAAQANQTGQITPLSVTIMEEMWHKSWRTTSSTITRHQILITSSRPTASTGGFNLKYAVRRTLACVRPHDVPLAALSGRASGTPTPVA